MNDESVATMIKQTATHPEERQRKIMDVSDSVSRTVKGGNFVIDVPYNFVIILKFFRGPCKA